MAAILQTTFSNAFSWLKNMSCNQIFTKVCPYKFNYQYGNIGSNNSLAPNRRQAIIWTNDGLIVALAIYAALILYPSDVSPARGPPLGIRHIRTATWNPLYIISKTCHIAVSRSQVGWRCNHSGSATWGPSYRDCPIIYIYICICIYIYIYILLLKWRSLFGRPQVADSRWG